jgi:dTDP-L-rhamnose 4-epimerase
MNEKILVTGGAGFIGSFLVDALISAGNYVRVLDNLEPQVHGGLRESGKKPDYLNPEADFILGDIRDKDVVSRALEGIGVVFHEAALVGVGQSMYDIDRYTSVNAFGTAVLLNAIINMKQRPRKMIVASSMSIYGEGAYNCSIHHEVFPKLRENAQFLEKDWDMHCPKPGCTEHLTPWPTNEEKPLYPTSIYAINKRDHEEMFLAVGRAYNIPVVALRYFNTYGPRQALSNPYTGVAAIFSSRLLNGNSLVLFEDGKQLRDFVHVQDVVQANLLVMDKSEANYRIFNVGTGRSISILQIANILMGHFNNLYKDRNRVNSPSINITQEFRSGDIRHCYSDISSLRSLGYKPRILFEDGIIDLVNWIIKQTPSDNFDQAKRELTLRGLVG